MAATARPDGGKSDRDPPLVFVYMAVRDGAPFLDTTLASILGQSHRHLRLCVVDDGSVDGTPSILERWARADARVVHRRQEPAGEVAARNRALAELPDDAVYLINHDADDLSEPGKLAALVAFLDEHPDVDLVGSQALYIDGQGRPLRPLSLPTDPGAIDRTFHRDNSLVHSATLYRRAVLARIGGYRERWRSVDDYDFFARALQAGFRAANLPAQLHRIRLHQRSVCATRGARQEQLRLGIAARLERTLPWRLAARAGQRSGVALHLGCGDRYLEGYCNVDLGDDDHTVQLRHEAPDLEEDIRYLVLPPGSCREVRSHHVFEHFPRVEALQLLIEWHRWLEPGGRLVVETPDLLGSLPHLTADKPPALRGKVLRHLFGSQEAHWAFHTDAWDEARFRHTLPALGFEVDTVAHDSWQDLANVTVTARRVAIDAERQLDAARRLLSESMVDGSESEQRMLEQWLRQLAGRS